MTVTLTLNPAAEQSLWVSVDPGTVHRVFDNQIDLAGKGINVWRIANPFGWPTIAFGILAGDTGDIVQEALHQAARESAVKRRSTVGCRDSTVAGLAVALARGDELVSGLPLGTAAGAVTAVSTGTGLGVGEGVSPMLAAVEIEALP